MGKKDWFRIFQERYESLKASWPEEKIQTLEKDSAKAAADFQDRSIDLVFIDADHSYEGCKMDIQAWLPKVREGGIISGHDYKNYEGVTRAVDELVDDVNAAEDYVWWAVVL